MDELLLPRSPAFRENQTGASAQGHFRNRWMTASGKAAARQISVSPIHCTTKAICGRFDSGIKRPAEAGR
jgi:hypothetical protein